MYFVPGHADISFEQDSNFKSWKISKTTFLSNKVSNNQSMMKIISTLEVGKHLHDYISVNLTLYTRR